MTTSPPPGPSSLPQAEVIVRTLRHEVGDLLQVVYAAVTLLRERLPAAQPEQSLLAELRTRAETCKHELDAVYDLVTESTLRLAPLDLGELAGELATFQARFPAIQIVAEASGPVPVYVDAQRLKRATTFLLLNACHAARRVVLRVEAATERGEAEWNVTSDGPSFTPDQLAWLEKPFPSTHHARAGLAFALAKRVAELHGGTVMAENLPEGGTRVRLLLPFSLPA
jgi:signal transduction histidine kinase